MIRITPELLVAALGARAPLAERYAEPLNRACAEYKISATPERLAHFLAQIGHESGALRWVSELWGPTPAQSRYEGRQDLGNTQLGDGYRFRGRGLIQLTGRANYATFTARMRERYAAEAVPDFEQEPERLEEPEWAVLAACDFWDRMKLNQRVDEGGTVSDITRIINGGYNGLDDRQKRFTRARRALADILNPATTEAAMPLPLLPIAAAAASPFLTEALKSVIRAAPDLLSVFTAGGTRKEKAAKVAEVAVRVAKEAVGAQNEQDLVERLESDPQAQNTVREAVKAHWYEIAMIDAGGGGIGGAREADMKIMQSEGPWWGVFRSPSFIVGFFGLLPLVYLIVLSLIGVIGLATWSDDVRAGIAGMITGTIVGGLVGYYYGQTTSRNRT